MDDRLNEETGGVRVGEEIFVDEALLEECVVGVALANNKAPVTRLLTILLCVGIVDIELAPEEVPKS